ncbi:hypothetical protein [uncultured Eudoraea sp.]|uniref:hypothetical protein n=1 Tax=uncultured Eudoraea sp. TaxID=1035614 RepID=UPI0026072858|nr:hypothetical protein [uncultured Eudoraea sp.]
MKNHNLRTVFYILLVVLLTPGLNAQKKAKLTPETKEELKTARVLMVRYQAPPLYFMTPKDVVGEGLIADLTQSDIADNTELHRFYPEDRVQENLSELFKSNGLMTNVEVKEEASEFMMPAELKEVSKYANVDADYIVEVIIPLMGWKASYGTTKWRTYHLNLAVEMRIIRKSDLARVWKTNVGYGGYMDKDMRFHITELEDNGKEMISNKLDKMAMKSSELAIAKYVKAKK